MDDSTSSTVQGAKKFEQIGGDAADKVLESLTTGAELGKGGRNAFIIVDLHIGVGNFFDGFLARRRASTVPLFYIAAGEDTTTLEWLHKTKLNEIADLFGEDKLVIPGHVKAAKDTLLNARVSLFLVAFAALWLLFALSSAAINLNARAACCEEPPTTLLETAPTKPKLNMLVISEDDQLKLPDAVVKQWYHDIQFGHRFKNFVDRFSEEFPAKERR